MATSRICSISDCGKRVRCRGWCAKHYDRWLQYGDTNLRGTAPGEARQYFAETVLPYDGNDCLLWPYGRNVSGYGRINVGGRIHLVSRLICEDANGPAPTPKHDAAHSCGNGHLGCVARRHLSWKTRAENVADKIIHGTHLRGSRQWNTKLTEGNVREIRSLRGKLFQREIASLYGVRKTTISAIFRGDSWAWLT